MFVEHQRRNYQELLTRYTANGNTLLQMKDQYLFDTRDWITCIDLWGLPDIYKDPKCLPFLAKDWKRIIENKWYSIYRSEFDDFMAGNGKLLTLIFGSDMISARHHDEPYIGFIDELKCIYSDDISTDTVSRSLGLISNSTKLNYQYVKVNDEKCCPHCIQRLDGNAANHLIL